MAIPTLSGSYIDETYQRLVQTNDARTEFADGLGQSISFGQTPTGSLLITASVSSNTITFTKGDGSTFPITVATGSGGGSFNTATGSYGSFYSTQTQTNVAGTARSMSLNVTDITNGVSISGSTNPYNTYIKTQNAGVYDIQFSAQVDKTDSGTDEIWIWLRKNGTDINDSATSIQLVGNGAHYVAAWNFFVNAAANDYFQLMWYSPDANVRLHAEPAFGVVPGIPSLIVTANRVDQFLSNTGSFTGSFTGSLFGTASYATNALTASFAPNYVLNSVTASFATTGSNRFIGNQTISGSVTVTGSLTVSGSSTFTNIGPAIFSGSVTVTSEPFSLGNSINTSTNTKKFGQIGGGNNYFEVEADSWLATIIGGNQTGIFINTQNRTYLFGDRVTNNTQMLIDDVAQTISLTGAVTGSFTGSFGGKFAEKMTTTTLGNTDPLDIDITTDITITETGTYIISSIIIATTGYIYFPDPSLYVGQKIRIQNRTNRTANIATNGNEPIDISSSAITTINSYTTKTFIAGERTAGAYSWIEI
jgi:hypothetical protein